MRRFEEGAPDPRHPRPSTPCIRTSGSGGARAPSSSASSPSASSITRPTRCWPPCSGGCWWPRPGPTAWNAGSTNDPTGIAPRDPCTHRLPLPRDRGLHRVFAFQRARGKRAGRRLFPGQPYVALRGQHDGVHDPGLLGSRLQPWSRDLRSHGFVLRARSPPPDLPDRHPGLGSRQEIRLHHPGAALPRPLGDEPHRHRDLRRPGRPARPLHRDRSQGGRHPLSPRSAAASSLSGWGGRWWPWSR